MSDYLGGLEDGGVNVDYSAGILPGTTQKLDPGTPGGAGDTGAMLGTGTGLHGVVPVEGGGGTIMGAFNTVYEWLRTPLVGGASSFDVAILVGVVLMAFIGWSFILYHIRIAAEAI